MKRFLALTIFIVLMVCGIVAAQTERPDGERRQGREGRAGLLKRADANQDGRISRDEWKRSPEVFDRLDADKDGALSREELQAARKNRGDRMHRGERLRAIDKNNDGQISREEWPGNQERFDRLDANHDGVITREEVRAGKGSRHRSNDPSKTRRPSGDA